MRRRDAIHFFHGCQNIISNPMHAAVATAVYGFEADDRDFRCIAEAAALGIGKLFQTHSQSHTVVRNMGRNFLTSIADFAHTGALWRADPIDGTARQLLLAAHLEQAKLETCRTKVRDQDFATLRRHGDSSPSRLGCDAVDVHRPSRPPR
jgi:hypothetical protein